MGRGVRDRRGESVIRFVAPGRAFYPDRCCATAQKKNAFSPPSIRSVRTWNPEECRSRFFSFSSSNVSLIMCMYAASLRRRSLGVLRRASRRECKIIASVTRLL